MILHPSAGGDRCPSPSVGRCPLDCLLLCGTQRQSRVVVFLPFIYIVYTAGKFPFFIPHIRSGCALCSARSSALSSLLQRHTELKRLYLKLVLAGIPFITSANLKSPFPFPLSGERVYSFGLSSSGFFASSGCAEGVETGALAFALTATGSSFFASFLTPPMISGRKTSRMKMAPSTRVM